MAAITQLNTIDFRNALQPFLNEWRHKANNESMKRGFAESFRYDSDDRKLLDHILIEVEARILATLKSAERDTEAT